MILTITVCHTNSVKKGILKNYVTNNVKKGLQKNYVTNSVKKINNIRNN